MHLREMGVALLLLSGAARAQTGNSVFPTKEEKEMARLLQEAGMTSEVRAFIRSKMKTHNKDMRDLVMAVSTLRYEEAKKWAQGIANAPRLDAAQSSKLELPAAFFSLQDVLKKQATGVVSACETKNADELVSSFTSMMNTCVGCHKAFMVPVQHSGVQAKAPAGQPAKEAPVEQPKSPGPQKK